ncbi:MAG: pantetheine-phosphate adenylyltransferase [Bacilli bacterium]|nr:pantetheine-phosphate adenylyltransferase [Bacilli bacterium]
MNKIGIYPGSFDPLTYGHLDLIQRGSRLFDKLYIAISINPQKKTLFTIDERKAMVEEAVKDIPNVEVVICDKLISQFAKEVNATCLLRGLRAVTDFEFELQMASTNNMLNPDVDTIFMMTKTEYSYFSSSMVKEIAQFNGDISSFVPSFIAKKIYEKYNHKKEN